MVAKPDGQRLALAAGQYVDGAPPFQIYQDRRVRVAFAEREIVNTQHPDRLDWLLGEGAQET
ncbi:hypothetical protein [Streptomyces sp. NPDC057582]|uniref:hypothetical protein n=1 Tax=Streptomyces sp. NPDC057582 TaxID=3346174 RepID=UPI0036B0B2A1